MTSSTGGPAHGGAGGGETWQERERRRADVVAQARRLPREPAGWMARLVLGAAVLAWAACLVWSWRTLPDVVPIHWGSNGDAPDRWGSRTESLLTSAAVGALVVLPLPLLSRLTFVWPDGINLPHKDWWLDAPRRVVRFERLVREDLMWITALTIGFITLLEVSSTQAALRPGGVMPEAGFWWVTVVYLLLVGVVTLRMAVGPRYRPDESDPALR